MSDIYAEVRAERERAHAKHGDTSMEAQPWYADLRQHILIEEVGEVSKEFNEARHRGDAHPDPVRLRKELIQVAAMATAWADALSSRVGSPLVIHKIGAGTWSVEKKAVPGFRLSESTTRAAHPTHTDTESE